MLVPLVLLDSLAFPGSTAHEKLASMSIHSAIKTRRLALGWSHETLAKKVSEAEGRKKDLTWQTVQQWEREDGTAPSRKRLDFVASALGCSVSELLGLDGSGTPGRRSDDERTEAALTEFANYFRELPPLDQAALLREAHDRAARVMGDRLLAEKFGVTGYMADDRLPPIYRDFERRRQGRPAPPPMVTSPLSTHVPPEGPEPDVEEGATE
jgi:transcriptional regulator with XRE-family HTH domain